MKGEPDRERTQCVPDFIPLVRRDTYLRNIILSKDFGFWSDVETTRIQRKQIFRS